MKTKQDIIKKYFGDEYRFLKFKFKELPNDKIKIVNFLTENVLRKINNMIRNSQDLSEGEKIKLMSKITEIGIIFHDLTN